MSASTPPATPAACPFHAAGEPQTAPNGCPISAKARGFDPFDAAYMRVNLKDTPINSTSSTGTRLTGQVEGNANVFGLGATYKF